LPGHLGRCDRRYATRRQRLWLRSAVLYSRAAENLGATARCKKKSAQPSRPGHDSTAACAARAAMTSRFTVALASGDCFDSAADEDLLSAAQRANWLVRFGCRNGNCEACEALLVSGRVEQQRGAQQHLLDAATPIQILLCQCRARSDLILAFDSDPTPGSYAQSHAFRAQLIDMRTEPGLA